MKRLNPITNKFFKSGDVRPDGKFFYAYSNRVKKDGFFIEMWLCEEAFLKQKTLKQASYERQKDLVLQKNKQYYIENKQKILDYKKAYKQANRSRYSALNRIRELNKTQRTPCWLTKQQQQEIFDIYAKAGQMTKQHGIQYHVDHIVPLCGKTVSGLHVPWNLRVITAEQNLKKHNKFLVD